MLRKMVQDDMSEVIKLWQKVFGDEKEKIELWVTSLAKMENVFVACEDGALVAQLLAVPCSAHMCKGVYFYALATNPSERGKGTMTKLMEYAEKYYTAEGFSFVCLVPASPPLFAFYAKRGYTKTTKLTNYLFTLKEDFASRKNYTISQINACEFSSLRKNMISIPHVSLEQTQYEIVLNDFYEQGGMVAFSNKAYCLFLSLEETVKVVEIFAKSDKDAEEILGEVCRYTNKKKIEVVSGQVLKGIFEKEKQSEYYFAMVKPLTSNFTVQDVYIRMVLEEF